jgi:UDP-N-acetylmuramoylalanine--D-glutamate ligase
MNSKFYQWLNQKFGQKKIAIIGLGVEGQNTLKHFKSAGLNVVSVGDKFQKEIDESLKGYWGDNWLDAVEGVDFVIRSPGINPSLEALKAFEAGVTLLGQIDLSIEFAPDKIVGITGTLGKGSSISILANILEGAQKNYFIGGNFGIPAFDVCLEDPDFYLLELSSFQTTSLIRSPKYCGLLQITSEHLDWHSDTLDYQEAKGKLVQFQSENDSLIYHGNYEATKRLSGYSKAKKIDLSDSQSDVFLQGSTLTVKTEVINFEDCQGLGVYQMQNRALACAIALELGVEIKDIVEGAKSWTGLPLRMEVVAKSSRVTFVNDSYATRPEATLGAVSSLNKPFSLVLGGSEKNADFTELSAALSKNNFLKKVVLIGATQERLAQSLTENKVPFVLTSLDNEVKSYFETALSFLLNEDEAVFLFSPACASFGLFENYKQRGAVFTEWAKSKV